MLKRIKNNLLTIGLKYSLVLAFILASFAAFCQPGNPFTGINIETVCWSNGGTDSTIYVAYLSAAGTSKATYLHYFIPNGTSTTTVNVSGGTVRPGRCSYDPIPTGVSTQVIQNTLSNPTFPAGVDEITVANYSSAYIALTTNKGTQTVGPNSYLIIKDSNLTFSSIAATSGTFGTGDYLVFNYVNTN